MLEIQHLSVQRAHREILTDISFSLPKGSMTALIGRNGNGKSTLISALGGTCPASGTVFLSGKDIASLSVRDRARLVAILPQVLRAPHMTVRELVSLGRHPYRTAISRPSREDLSAISDAIAEVGIDMLSERYLDEISGGERQRAYLAMILSQNAPLWLLDEPATYMDLSVASRFMELLSRLKREKEKTVLIAMHDLGTAVRYADHIALLDEGSLAFFGTVKECLATDIIERTFSVRRAEADSEIFFIG